MLEGAKSADPPINSGMMGAKALRQSWDHNLVALPPSSGVAFGKASTQPSGKVLSIATRLNWAANSGSAFWYFSQSLFHSSCF
eukprot:CAMPEP_0178435486 /NCGR_PEP_ID=MMETSP0689_2-20121128/33956_1 /TAXON_ID=160604 /ORGANISM="Amphidinium massartii, Strain CS-259" /LENGTH=82 /DNA_ID=CAMNT_0020057567 /DNA_START=79 /DNA_END=324 /DNA_ORIENTATION=-